MRLEPPGRPRSPLIRSPSTAPLSAGGGGDVVVALVIGSLLLVLLTCMADSSRALYGISADRMTIRQFHQLNRFGMPSRAMTVDLLINIALVFLLGGTLAIVAAGNLGYVLGHVFALSALLLLRLDRPQWPRPIRLRRPELAAVALLAAVLTVLLAVGSVSFELTGYGGRDELATTIALLLGSIVLYAYPVRCSSARRPRSCRRAPAAPRGVPQRTHRGASRRAASEKCV